jgi:CubicO group peptidase (beta-lactamase class C family)
LGIIDVEWSSSPQGITIGWSDLHLTPHDMAKIGYLYLNEGWWDGEQVVSAEWVRASTVKSTTPLPDNPEGVALLESRTEALANP